MLLELISESIRTLRLNLLRTILTMVGIILGVGAVVTIMNMGQSAYQAVVNMFESTGQGYLTISHNYSMGQSITFDDTTITLLNNLAVPGVVEYIPQAPYDVGTVSTTEQRLIQLWIGYSRPSTMANQKLDAGRWFTDDENEAQEPVIVIPANVARSNYGSSAQALGQQIEVSSMYDGSTAYYQVVGVLPPTPFESEDFGEAILPFELVKLTENYAYGGYSRISVKTETGIDYEVVGAALEQALMDEFGYESIEDSPFTVENVREEMVQISTMLTVMSVGLSLIAAISLLVGGVGIMNIMLVSVTERTKEIGLMKAIGARESDIVFGFLVEAVVMTIFGGIIGIGVGIGFSSLAIFLVNTFGGDFMPPFPYVIDYRAVIVSLVVSIAIGLIFGTWPAKRAAKLDPVEALRRD